jgi:hypothetical protein
MRRAASLAAWTAGSKSAIKTAMMAMTTSSSIRVKPTRRRGAILGMGDSSTMDLTTHRDDARRAKMPPSYPRVSRAGLSVGTSFRKRGAPREKAQKASSR